MHWVYRPTRLYNYPLTYVKLVYKLSTVIAISPTRRLSHVALPRGQIRIWVIQKLMGFTINNSDCDK
jgi:hypothetical protein